MLVKTEYPLWALAMGSGEEAVNAESMDPRPGTAAEDAALSARHPSAFLLTLLVSRVLASQIMRLWPWSPGSDVAEGDGSDLEDLAFLVNVHY